MLVTRIFFLSHNFFVLLKTCLISLASFNPLPDVPILGFSNSAENKDMMSKKYGQMGIQLSD